MNQTTLDFYGLRSDPLDPGPSSHPYLGSAHCNALAALYYHLEQGEKVPVLVGPSGVGKTTLLHLIEKRERAHRRTLLVSSSGSDANRMLGEIQDAPGINPGQRDIAALRTELQDLLTCDVKAREEITLVVDDAQNLDDSVLKLVRSLSAIQGPEKNALKLLLAGSTELQNRLHSLEFEDRLHWVPLAAMAPADVEAYLQHRLRVAGWTGNSIFLADACAAIGAWTDGVPKRVNEICSAILELGTAQQVRLIDAAWLDRNDILSGTATPGGAIRFESFVSRRTVTNACVAIFTIALGTALFYILRDQSRNLYPINSRVSASMARIIDAKMHDTQSAGSSTALILNTLGHAKADLIQSSSAQTTRPMTASAGKLPLTNAHTEEATLLHSPVLSSVPSSGNVQSFARSRQTPERSLVEQPPAPAFITSANIPHSAREPQQPAATVNTALVANRGAAPGSSLGESLLHTPYVPNASRWTASIAVITNAEKASDETKIGDAYMRLGDYGQALSRYQNALAMMPDSKAVQQKVSDSRAAEDAKERAVINREKSSVAIRLGDTYLLRGNYDKAISSFEGALKFTPGNREVQERLQRAIHARAAEAAVFR